MTDCQHCNGTGNDGGGPSENTLLERVVVSALAVHAMTEDRTAVREWMREPDYVENASLEWLLEWVNRRPLKQCEP